MRRINNNVLVASVIEFFAENFVVTKFEFIDACSTNVVTCDFEIQIMVSEQFLTFKFNYHAELLGVIGTSYKRTFSENCAISKVFAEFKLKMWG